MARSRPKAVAFAGAGAAHPAQRVDVPARRSASRAAEAGGAARPVGCAGAAEAGQVLLNRGWRTARVSR